MDVRIILVPLTGTGGDEPALMTARLLACQSGASIRAAFLHPDAREAVLRLGEGASTDIMARLRRAVESGAILRDLARRHFEAALSADGEIVASWQELHADEGAAHGLESALVHVARLADLIVFPRVIGPQTYSMLQAVLLGAGRPLLMAPARPPVRIGDEVAIAWNATTVAVRALCAAMPLLRQASKVHVLTVETPRTRAEAATELLEYLRQRNVEATAHLIRANGAPVGKMLLTEAGVVGADLLVMGGYGHSRLRELLLGGVTRYVVSHADLPILMAH